MKKIKVISVLLACLSFTLLTALLFTSCIDPGKTYYVVTFDRNYDSNDSYYINRSVVEAGSEITLGSSLYSRSGYTLIGWNTNASGTGTNYDIGQIFKPDGDITLYAVWAIPLIVNEWANGSIAQQNETVWYSFSVISGTTYYIWWNDLSQGDSSKTANVSVNANYSSGSNIFSNIDSGWTSPQTFTANTSGTVKLRVTSSNSTTGTFAIVYSTGSTRPGGEGISGGVSNIRSIAYGNGKFATGTEEGEMAYSADGITWTATTNHPFSGGMIYSIVWGNNKFVAGGIGSDDKRMMASSADGINWTEMTINVSSSSNSVFAIAWGSDKFVIGGQYGVAYSVDGVTWTAVSSDNLDNSIEQIGWGNGKFVAGTTKIAYSTDGITWSKPDNDSFGPAFVNGSANSGYLWDFAWGGDKYIAVGDYGPSGNKSGRIAYSTDANNWTVATNSIFGTTTVSAVAYGNGKFIAGGSSNGFSDVNGGKMAFSSDGITWTAVADSKFGTAGIYKIVYGNSKFVAVGTQNRIAYSTDGITWTAVANSPFR